MSDAVKDAAARIIAAQCSGRPIPRLPETSRPLSLGDVYAIQDMVAAELGPIGGWKVGPSAPDAAPSCAPVFARDILPSGTVIDAAGLHGLALEIEFAFRVTRDLPARDLPYTYEEVAAAVEFVPLIEMVASRFLDREAMTELERLADRNANGAFVVGAPVVAWRDLDFRKQPVTLMIDGRQVQSAVGTHPAGDPAILVHWQANHCAARGLPLKRGDVVTTGSLCGLTPTEAGIDAVGDWGDWGRVTVRLS